MSMNHPNAKTDTPLEREATREADREYLRGSIKFLQSDIEEFEHQANSTILSQALRDTAVSCIEACQQLIAMNLEAIEALNDASRKDATR